MLQSFMKTLINCSKSYFSYLRIKQKTKSNIVWNLFGIFGNCFFILLENYKHPVILAKDCEWLVEKSFMKNGTPQKNSNDLWLF